uniref:Uncharacterized protein n=1 Tax=Marseillevirus LCMAC101 TaxID=2506602 RepID=A0A481YQX5_9VIRU|nr:MAG: hypothetical protein LCMAC101_01630 [Marseillevirus LCMAC101]
MDIENFYTIMLTGLKSIIERGVQTEADLNVLQGSATILITHKPNYFGNGEIFDNMSEQKREKILAQGALDYLISIKDEMKTRFSMN